MSLIWRFGHGHSRNNRKSVIFFAVNHQAQGLDQYLFVDSLAQRLYFARTGIFLEVGLMFSDSERVIGAMLAAIGKHLEIKTGVDFDQIEKALVSRYDWSLYFTHGELLTDDYELPEDVQETCQILGVWRDLRSSYSALSGVDQMSICEKFGVSDFPEFEGFDANNDAHYGIASHLLSIDRYAELADKTLNSHDITTLPRYRRMLAVYGEARASKGFSNLSANELIEILGAGS